MTIDAKFAALADPTRRAILARLVQGQASAGDLAAPFDISQPAISRHLKVLEQAGMITREVKAQRRLFALAPGALDGVDACLHPLRQALDARFNRLDDVLDDLANRSH